MENSELFQQIKSDVFLRLGIKLSDQDPIFAMVLANQATMQTFSGPIVSAIESIPDVLEGTLNIIATAVEEAEKTAGTLTAETKALLVALSKVEIESAHQRIREAVESSVDKALANSLNRVQADVQAIESKVKSMGANFRDRKASLLNLVLAGALFTLIGVFSLGLYVLYDIGVSNRNSAEFWKGKYSEQQDVISNLPPSVKKLFGSTAKGN